MSCNAWNHPPDCSCGWGGVFYGSGYRDGADDSWHWQRSDSYTTPNARCPRCAARVFFYRSPYGGSVYFEDLGPPWPKHPCMDVSRRAALRLSPHPAIPPGSRPAASVVREIGWKPLICDEVRPHERCSEVVVLKVQSGPGGARVLYAVFDRSLLDYRTPFVARRKPDGTVDVSTLNTRVEVPVEVRFLAYLSTDDLPQAWRDKIDGVKRQRVATAVAVERPIFTLGPPSPSTERKASAALPKPVQITYRHHRPDGTRPKAKKLLPQSQTSTKPRKRADSAADKAATPLPASRSRSEPGPRHEKDGPLTNMALAFQKLALSDPTVEEFLINGTAAKESK